MENTPENYAPAPSDDVDYSSAEHQMNEQAKVAQARRGAKKAEKQA